MSGTVGQELIYTIKHIASIHEVTELEKRLNDLEDLLRGFGDLNKWAVH